jgi:hypothetical protein
VVGGSKSAFKAFGRHQYFSATLVRGNLASCLIHIGIDVHSLTNCLITNMMCLTFNHLSSRLPAIAVTLWPKSRALSRVPTFRGYR